MLTFQDSYTKAQRLAKSNNSDVLTQLKQDLNTGYHMFNAKLSRYFTRKQQFTDIVADQSIYQVPIDCVRVMGMTTLVTSTYQPPVKEIRSEYEWRQITSYPVASNWPAYYYMLGSDEFQLWPTPSQDVTNGLRYYYQPQDHDLTLADVTSTTTSKTVTVTNGSTTVTASASGAFTADMATLYFQVTGITDVSWYEIVAGTTTTITLKSAYVGTSGSGLAWRVGQSWIIPEEYHDAPMHYALANFFSAQGSETRAAGHMAKFQSMIDECKEEYSSSNQSGVIDDADTYLNPWTVPPLPG